MSFLYGRCFELYEGYKLQEFTLHVVCREFAVRYRLDGQAPSSERLIMVY